MTSKQKIIGAIVAIGLVFIAIFGQGLYKHNTAPQAVESSDANSGVKVVSTNPPNLDGATISPTQTIWIKFNKPMVRDNTRIVVEPQGADYKTDLSDDHKSIKIMANFQLGANYTITIKGGYGTDTGEHLDSDQVFHVQTISYNGV
jgi:hypothetical protein